MPERVLVVGAGPGALRSVPRLLEQGHTVTVAGTDPTPALADLADRGRITLVESADPAGFDRVVRTTGRVSLVGGGPGDPGLITMAGRAALDSADVVVVDHLAPLGLLAELDPRVEIVDAAKLPRGTSAGQDAIAEVLVSHARAGRHVVRLKGGDPYVFGRGREELDICRAAGLPVDVIPGVTSAVAVPAAAGIPMTFFGGPQAFTVVSGHVPPGDPRSTLDWAALARSGATLVLLMAVAHLQAITDTLASAGLDPATPAAAVQDGGRVVATGTLADIAGQDIAAPAVVVIGQAARYAEPPPPPAGRRVLVLGGSGSGKSEFAESLLAEQPTTYLAPGEPAGDDAEWAGRIARHQQRRPGHWSTAETTDLVPHLSDTGAPLLIDCLSTWLARVMDARGAWNAGSGAAITHDVDAVVDGWAHTSRHVVAVSSEVGSGIVPDTTSGRLFRDELGRLNQRIAATADEVWLVTAGVPRRLR